MKYLKLFENYGTYIRNGIEYPQKEINQQAQSLPVIKVNISDIKIEQHFYWRLQSLSDFLFHANRIMALDSEIDVPIILDEEYKVVDGNHRLAKYILDGKTTISAKIFTFPS